MENKKMKIEKEFNIKTDKHELFFRDNKPLKLIRAKDGEEGAKSKLVGRAIVFNSESLPVGVTMSGKQLKEVREVIAPEALDRVLGMPYDIRALSSHDSSAPSVIGRTKSGTLALEKDADGLLVSITIPDTSVGRDLETLIERGDIDGMSFGFYPDWETIEMVDKGDYVLQVIHNIREVLEVSVVAWPAYPATSINVRELKQIAAPVVEEEKKENNLSLFQKRLEVQNNQLNKYV